MYPYETNEAISESPARRELQYSIRDRTPQAHFDEMGFFLEELKTCRFWSGALVAVSDQFACCLGG